MSLPDVGPPTQHSGVSPHVQWREAGRTTTPGDVSGHLTARGKPDSALLWTFIGDPDSGELRVLRKVDTQP
ncbi:hypothetical protein ACFU9X_28515 [Streptomyces atratus]|uniref:hypothetical protein n=1 Tax=Streptomyces atratus TaxID=1893 RepID=UPI00369F1BED